MKPLPSRGKVRALHGIFLDLTCLYIFAIHFMRLEMKKILYCLIIGPCLNVTAAAAELNKLVKILSAPEVTAQIGDLVAQKLTIEYLNSDKCLPGVDIYEVKTHDDRSGLTCKTTVTSGSCGTEKPAIKASGLFCISD